MKKYLLLGVFFLNAPLSATTLCKNNEVVVFHCAMKESKFSVCKRNDYIYYKHEKNNKVDFTYPETNRKGDFYFSYTGYSGGGESHIRFENSNYHYIIYDRIIRSEDYMGRYPNFESGISIMKDGSLISHQKCEISSGINENASQSLLKEKFVDLIN
ncbi:hypothetical protein CE143_16765 [Photorhabdus luminescens]|uniref:Uncharacterized protein n=1 Tax=Photorhabdus akhurstii TaxID=171438 RepID=A0ABX8M2C0_9GAMM|nr:hypothetical protein [Photorhabdus akhurstii]QXF34629.1 hypothetical protein B0X70_16770 [Photorhabdus akhurstii]UJD76456.1 hypothetical protein CE143_16765 [Photorhabdus luminescens]